MHVTLSCITIWRNQSSSQLSQVACNSEGIMEACCLLCFPTHTLLSSQARYVPGSQQGQPAGAADPAATEAVNIALAPSQPNGACLETHALLSWQALDAPALSRVNMQVLRPQLQLKHWTLRWPSRSQTAPTWEASPPPSQACMSWCALMPPTCHRTHMCLMYVSSPDQQQTCGFTRLEAGAS